MLLMKQSFLTIVLLLLPIAQTLIAPRPRNHASFSLSLQAHQTQQQQQPQTNIEARQFEHNGWKCAYRYKPPSPTANPTPLPPLLLIHPVGIGLSSWFWEHTMTDTLYQGEIYAPDFIGCGRLGGDMWDPSKRGLSFPLGWVQQCETLIQTEIQKSSCVVVQGGVAPVGILLAARDSVHNPKKDSQLVSHLVLTSPPEYDNMMTPIPEETLQKNYNFYTSKPWGELAFAALENRWAIQLFSNLFLFKNNQNAHDRFVTLAVEECCSALGKQLRPPIMAFNAGLLQHRSFREEMESIRQPVLVLSGTEDPRAVKRVGYATSLESCVVETVDGKNVLPWESPVLTMEKIKEFCCSRF